MGIASSLCNKWDEENDDIRVSLEEENRQLKEEIEKLEREIGGLMENIK